METLVLKSKPNSHIYIDRSLKNIEMSEKQTR